MDRKTVCSEDNTLRACADITLCGSLDIVPEIRFPPERFSLTPFLSTGREIVRKKALGEQFG
jgi:hypothetical protein